MKRPREQIFDSDIQCCKKIQFDNLDDDGKVVDLVDDVWISHVLPFLSQIERTNFSCVSRRHRNVWRLSKPSLMVQKTCTEKTDFVAWYSRLTHIAPLLPVTLTVTCKGSLDDKQLSSICEVPAVHVLKIQNNKSISSLHFLSQSRILRKLYLSDCPHLQDLAALKGTRSLQVIHLQRCRALVDIEPISSVPKLRTLVLSGCVNIASIDSLSKSQHLQILDLSGCAKLRDISALQFSLHLRSLNLTGCYQIGEVSALSRLATLRIVDLRGCSLECLKFSQATLMSILSLKVYGLVAPSPRPDLLDA